jgi:hypothetical protein
MRRGDLPPWNVVSGNAEGSRRIREHRRITHDHRDEPPPIEMRDDIEQTLLAATDPGLA